MNNTYSNQCYINFKVGPYEQGSTLCRMPSSAQNVLAIVLGLGRAVFDWARLDMLGNLAPCSPLLCTNLF